MKERLFSRTDFFWSALVTLISFAVYFWTAAPSVTLQDSGEFMVAAQHFGVPHPSGYPLWTLFSWLFQLLPIGNAAWKINLFSGVCGALAVGLSCLLSRSCFRWIFQGDSTATTIGAVTSSLLLAFSVSMWTQAVIAEVYTLHCLFVVAYLIALYSWVRQPASKSRLLLVFFLLSLAFGHHQLTVALAPLPFLAVLLLRRRMFWDLVLASAVTTLMVYLGFSNLSKEPALNQTALRFFFCVMLGVLVLVWLRKGRVRWWLVAFQPFAVIAGLLPFLYLPLASGTNPPMNWGYAREAEGFYYSINRSQYSGSLADQSLATLGKLMGVTTAEDIKAGEVERSFKLNRLDEAQMYVVFYWRELVRSFTPFATIFYFCTVLLILRLALPERVWIYLLHIGFVLAAFLQPLKDRYQVDQASWATQMPWHAYSYLVFSLICGLGIAACLTWLARRFPRLRFMGFAVVFLPLWPLIFNYAESSQRNHWFGWLYGHDMLKDLPRDSIVIGGTDPGRFVPTYMIFGESPQPAKFKRDPDFDRRDLYIITQNALGEPNYMKYLRDQYTTARPEPRNAFERWLGRATAYPKEPITLPSPEEIKELLQKAVEEESAKGVLPDSTRTLAFGAILKWIWEHNRDKHEFFIEESFPLTWTYDYAVPHGFVYRMSPTKLDAIPPEAVAADFAFWKKYKALLFADPAFKTDPDAQRSFSKLRQTMANIYRYRKMNKEAEQAYFEALELWPNNIEVIVALMGFLGDRGDYDTIASLVNRALQDDPNNLDLWRLLGFTDKRKEMEGEINALTQKLKEQPKSRDSVIKLLQLYAYVSETNKAQPILQRAMQDFPEDADLLRAIIAFYEQTDQLSQTLDAASQLTKIEGSNVSNHLLLARAYFYQDKKKEFYETAGRAVEIGGDPVREAFAAEPTFARWRNQPEFQALVAPPQLAPH